MKFSLSLITTLAVVTAVIGQTTERMMCGSHPSAETVLRMEADFAANKIAAPKTPVPVTINVYVHVIYVNKTAEGGNVLDTQIAKQITILNTGFFNSSITFKLINTTRTLNSSWFNINGTLSDPQTKMKKALRQGAARDLNIYTVGSIIGDDGKVWFGYATFPDDYSKYPKNDGVVIISSTLPDGSQVGYNLGRIMTHEVGHWVGLYHTFQGGCKSPGDSVDDTPPERIPATDCKVRDSCPGGGDDPIHNFMDYTPNSCMYEFTPGQVVRLTSQIATYRKP